MRLADVARMDHKARVDQPVIVVLLVSKARLVRVATPGGSGRAAGLEPRARLVCVVGRASAGCVGHVVLQSSAGADHKALEVRVASKV